MDAPPSSRRAEIGIPRPGDTLGGRYIVEEVLGIGGMGAVLAARFGEQRVALKIMRADHKKHDRSAAKRFLREARIIASIDSPHVARLLDCGELDNGDPFMALELLRGQSLDRVLRERGPLAVEEAIDSVLQVCEGVAEAHSRGVVHRDLKPSNLFLTETDTGERTVKVLDFGISKRTGLGDARTEAMTLTESNALIGSPQYMSPEQLRSSRDVDARSDVWALGLITHKLLTGFDAFEATNLGEHFAMIVSDPPMPLRRRRPEAPEELERVVLTSLQKKASHRYQDVGQLACALAPFGPPGSNERAARVVRILSAAGAAAASQPALASAASLPLEEAPTIKAIGARSEVASSTWTPSTMPSRLRQRRSRIGMAVAASAAVAAFGWGLRSYLGDDSEGSDLSRAPAHEPVSPTVASAPSPAPASTIHVTVRAEPSSSRIEIDGKLVESSVPVPLPLGPEEHTLVVTAAGHDAYQARFDAAKDREYQVALPLSAKEPSSGPNSTLQTRPRPDTTAPASASQDPQPARPASSQGSGIGPRYRSLGKDPP